jgi:hypothetical protein
MGYAALVGWEGLISLNKVRSTLLDVASLQDPIPRWYLYLSHSNLLVCCVMRWL